MTLPVDTLIDYVPGLLIPGDEFSDDPHVQVVTDVEAILQSLGDAVFNGSCIGSDGIWQSTSEKDASATFTILTTALNQQGNKHQIGQNKYGLGMRADRWAIAPVVYLEHGKNPLYTLPLGVAEDDQRKLLLQVSRSRAASTCRFDQHSGIAMDIFRMVNANIMRMSSIGADPVKALPLHPPRQTQQNGVVAMMGSRPGWEFVETELREWSVCASGADPGALRQCFTDRKVGGERIQQTTLRIIEPYTEEKPAQGIGFDFARLEQKVDGLREAFDRFCASPPPAIVLPGGDVPPIDQTTVTAPAATDSPPAAEISTTADDPTLQQSLTEALQASFAPMRDGVKQLEQRITTATGKN